MKYSILCFAFVSASMVSAETTQWQDFSATVTPSSMYRPGFSSRTNEASSSYSSTSDISSSPTSAPLSSSAVSSIISSSSRITSTLSSSSSFTSSISSLSDISSTSRTSSIASSSTPYISSSSSTPPSSDTYSYSTSSTISSFSSTSNTPSSSIPSFSSTDRSSSSSTTHSSSSSFDTSSSFIPSSSTTYYPSSSSTIYSSSSAKSSSGYTSNFPYATSSVSSVSSSNAYTSSSISITISSSVSSSSTVPSSSPASSSSGTPTSGSGGSSQTMDAATAATLLDLQNAKRALHEDTPAFTWSDELSAWAYNYANSLTGTYYDPCSGRLLHSSDRQNQGENIAYATNADLSYMVDMWYNEIQYYDYNDVTGIYHDGQEVGHFTQLVWASSTQVGCATVECPSTSGTYLLCEYSPEGNIYNGNAGEDEFSLFKENVKPLKSSS